MECAICFEDLNDKPENAPPTPPPNSAPPPPKKRKTARGVRSTPTPTKATAVCTPCGHLFHRHCLVGWFEETTGGPGKGRCPLCQKHMYATQLYPAFMPAPAAPPMGVVAAPPKTNGSTADAAAPGLFSSFFRQFFGSANKTGKRSIDDLDE